MPAPRAGGGGLVERRWALGKVGKAVGIGAVGCTLVRVIVHYMTKINNK